MHGRPSVRFSRVLVAQMRLLLSVRYVFALAAVLTLGLLVLRTRYPQIDYARPVWAQAPKLPSMMPFLICFGCGAALLSWLGEPRSRRRYHRSLPVVHATHDVARILAGLIWLLVALALFCVVGAMTENGALFHEWLRLRNVPEMWVGFFVIPILVYLLSSIFTVAFDLPFAWIAAIVATVLILDSDTVETHAPEVSDLVKAVVNTESAYSFGQAISGWDDAWRLGVPLKHHSHWAYWRRSLEFKQWREALIVWYALALCGLTLAVRRKPVG